TDINGRVFDPRMPNRGQSEPGTTVVRRAVNSEFRIPNSEIRNPKSEINFLRLPHPMSAEFKGEGWNLKFIIQN
ncbi:MAG: hypothetical protein MUP13_09590, partial [Thermoanaerobaculales bacterium]|nr:hypothetical protein [Thermoanaerobaculales bacterium]